MSIDRNLFVKHCESLSDLEQLPAVAMFGDVCKHQGKFWVYEMDMGKTSDGLGTIVGKWFTMEDAAKRVTPVEFSAPFK